MKNFGDLKIGLVLSGGGAKGAYEAGVFKAIWDLDLFDNIRVISGTSIGSVNALLFAMKDKEVITNSWNSISYSRFMSIEPREGNRINKIIETVKNINIQERLLDRFRKMDKGLFSQIGVRDFLEEYVDINYINQRDVDIYSCAYNIDKSEPEYFKLNDYEEEDIINIVLASCAIPFVFKPVYINGMRYADGGINSPEYLKNNADNVPIKPLKNYNCDLIIVIHLSYKNNNCDKSGFDESKIIEIYPSNPLEYIKGIGSLMISPKMLIEGMDLGYRDFITAVAPIIINILKNKSFDEHIKRNKERNKNILENQ